MSSESSKKKRRKEVQGPEHGAARSGAVQEQRKNARTHAMEPGVVDVEQVSSVKRSTDAIRRPYKAQHPDRHQQRPEPKACSGSEEPFWPYPTEYLDHFETSKEAIADLEPALYRLATHLGKPKSELVVYDPYYCKGAIRQHWERLGVKRLIHEKRDFYADVTSGSVPDYDILVTNPPYSGDHKERILQFCMESGKAWALLMPNYVATKLYFTRIASTLLQRETFAAEPFFLVPTIKYDYVHPEGTGHNSSPFFSIWYIHMANDTKRILAWWEKQLSKGKSSACLLRSVSELQESQFVPTGKRPNPKQRKKMRKEVAAV